MATRRRCRTSARLLDQGRTPISSSSREVISPNRYARGTRPREGLQLGFAAVNEPEIKRGAENLAIAMETAQNRRK